LGGIWQTGGILRTLYRLGFLLLNASLAVYLIYFGWRVVNAKKVRTSGFGWGEMIIGTLILYIQAGFDYHLIPNRPFPIHMPSNLAEAASVLVCDLIGVYLIFRGIWAGFSRREPEPNIHPTQSAESGR
jgi:hypothetical protein